MAASATEAAIGTGGAGSAGGTAEVRDRGTGEATAERDEPGVLVQPPLEVGDQRAGQRGVGALREEVPAVVHLDVGLRSAHAVVERDRVGVLVGDGVTLATDDHDRLADL